jgi:hypothetical protein
MEQRQSNVPQQEQGPQQQQLQKLQQKQQQEQQGQTQQQQQQQQQQLANQIETEKFVQAQNQAKEVAAVAAEQSAPSSRKEETSAIVTLSKN